MKADVVRSLNGRTLSEPGLPPLVMVMDGLWQTGLPLPALARLQKPRPPSPFGPEPIETTLEEGDVLVCILSRETTLSGNQLLALKALESLDGDVAAAAVTKVFAEYPAIRARYDHLPDEDFPALAKASDLVPLIDLRSIVVHSVQASAWPYFGIEFRCRWDEEHGIGLMMRGAEVVEMGGGDLGMMGEIAQADHRRRAQAPAP